LIRRGQSAAYSLFPVGQLPVASVLHDQPAHGIPSFAAALVACDHDDVEFADQIAEDDRGVRSQMDEAAN